MNTINSSTSIDRQSTRSKTPPGYLRLVQILSWVVTLIFLVALVWAIYQALVNGNPLPIWAWLGLIALLAVAIGLGVMVIVYRGVVREVGPFNFSSSSHMDGEQKSEARIVESAGASSLHATFNMMEGILQLMDGTQDVMEAAFTYDDADWKPPEVDYSVDAASLGSLVVEQKATGRPTMRQGRCEWVIHLNQDLPTDLNIKFGAGKADLKLGGMTIENLRVESGVGALVMDLSGVWRHSMQAFIKAGIGDTAVRLPKNVGVRVQTTVGLGSTQPRGLTWDGEAYINNLYGQSQVTLDITIEGGMGKINLEQAG